MANSSLAVRIFPETQRTLAFGSISGTYAKVGTPLDHAAIVVIFQNLTAGIMTFSWDGTNDHITLAAGTSFVLDVQTNKGRGEAMMVAQSTQFWVKQVTPPASGAVYISVFYGAGII